MFVSVVLDASPSVKVVIELQRIIAAMLRAAADSFTDDRRIPYQIIVSWNAKLHGLYITLFVTISYSGVDLTIDANSQSAVASQLRRHIHDVIMAGDGPSVLLTSEHVIPVLIEHEFLRACDSVSTQKWDGRSERLTEKIYPNLASKACWLSLWPQASKESEWHPGQMPHLLLERGIRLNPRVSGRRGKVKAKDGVIGICRAGLETLRAL